MLILGRKVGQSVIIGNEIKVTVLNIGPKLKLAIDSPKHMQVSTIKQSLGKLEKKRTRKVGETVLIGENVKLSILQVESGLLRFAIEAPKEINVCREEIYERKNDSLTKGKIKSLLVFEYERQSCVSVQRYITKTKISNTYLA